MSNVIDFHSHILPDMDDGSSSVEESISMLYMEKEQGITHVVATPHFYAGHDRPEDFLKRRDRAEEQLRMAMAEHPGLPSLSVGAEVYYFRGIGEMESLRKLAIRGTSCVMIEMPDAPWPDSAFAELERLYERLGILPIVAHVDRYIAPLRTYGIPAKLAKLPVLVQSNGDFFLRRSTAAMAIKMLREDRIHLLGSDCHNTTTRQPNLGSARKLIQRRVGAAFLERVDDYGADILQSKE